MGLQSAKIIVTLFDEVCEQMNKNFTYARKTGVDSIEPNRMQNANDIYWKTVEQQRKLQSGWDITGGETDTIEQSYPLKLNDPLNDFMGYRIDQLRDQGFMNRAAIASANQFNATQNKDVADLIARTGSLYYESSDAGFDFVAEADTLMTERQYYDGEGRSFFMNPRTYKVMGSDLASRTLFPNNRSEEAYASAMIGENVAGFDVMRAPTYGTINAAAAGTTTVASDVTLVPQGATGTDSPSNVDYRSGVISLTDASSFAVGDVITFENSNALGLLDKTDTGQLMTFKIIAKDGNDVTVFPKPIAADQAGITTEQAAYANISTSIDAGDTVAKVNTTGGQSNPFWANDSITFVNGEAPLELLNEFDGMKVTSQTLDSGITLFLAHDANLATMQARVRLFTWYGLVNVDPSRNGSAVYTPA